MIRKKFFIISFFLSICIIAFNSSYVFVNGREVEFSDELETATNNLFDKGLAICKEISDVSNFQVINSINRWYSNFNTADSSQFGHGGSFTGGKISTMDSSVWDIKNNEAFKYIVYYGSFLLLPVDLTLNFAKLIFNCFNILIGSKVRIQSLRY